MNAEVKKKIENVISERKRANYALSLNSKVFEDFGKVNDTAFEPGEISRLNKELIAFGIALITNCESCMEWHIHQAIASGVTEKQLYEVIDLAIAMAGGSVTVTSRFALNVIEYYKEKEYIAR